MENKLKLSSEIPPDAEAYNSAIRELTHLNLRLRALDKAKDEFISIASHELRNPMAIIKGTLTMILNGDDGSINDEVRDDLKDLMIVIERQIRMVNELLDVSRIEAGVIFFNLSSEIDVSALSQLLADSLNTVTRENNVKVVVKPEGNLPKVQADQDKISQVLINLVTNSLKFTKAGSVTIGFTRKEDFVVTSVVDTGSGMPKDTQEQLFKKFTKPGDPKVGTMSPGSGLGLYISKKYIEHLGGELWVEKSEVGVGSTFCFSLPIKNSSVAQKVAEEIKAMQILKDVHFKSKEVARNG